MKANLVVAAAFVVCGTIASGSAANILNNGGFEAGTGPDADGWAELQIFGGSLGATAVAARSNVNPRSGDWAMDLAVTGAGDFGPVAEIQQQTMVGSVVGGAMYDFSFFATGVAGPGTVGFYEVLWFDGDGSAGGGPQGSATGLQTFAFGPTYQEFGQSSLVAPGSADSVLVQIRIVTGAFDGALGSATIDDVSFALVPAPGAAGVLAMGGLAAMRRRR